MPNLEDKIMAKEPQLKSQGIQKQISKEGPAENPKNTTKKCQHPRRTSNEQDGRLRRTAKLLQGPREGVKFNKY
ncbi:hypothetical protein ABW21_db0209669 [Orbilia brochopaga]|nr:hypothetical protein ABW21_db0209669 [Drechslerella brochopaga]